MSPFWFQMLQVSSFIISSSLTVSTTFFVENTVYSLEFTLPTPEIPGSCLVIEPMPQPYETQ